jgi:hypothetical protein
MNYWGNADQKRKKNEKMNEMLDVISMFDHDGAIIENSSYGCPPFQNELGMAGANVKEKWGSDNMLPHCNNLLFELATNYNHLR